MLSERVYGEMVKQEFKVQLWSPYGGDLWLNVGDMACPDPNDPTWLPQGQTPSSC